MEKAPINLQRLVDAGKFIFRLCHPLASHGDHDFLPFEDETPFEERPSVLDDQLPLWPSQQPLRPPVNPYRVDL